MKSKKVELCTRTPEAESGTPPHPSTFRRVLPQVLASTAKNLLLLDLGMTLAFPTIVIPSLLKGEDPYGLTFNSDDSSWFGSIAFICQPVGSLLSGIVLEPLGRKYSMMIVNLPHIAAWIMCYMATTKATLYAGAVIFGLGVGFMEAPIITYVGEIAEPGLRGTLTAFSNLFATFGLVLLYGLGTALPWRLVALISAAVPSFTFLAISQVPETPMWLVGRGREEEAEKALCWLRGWVSPALVKQELEQLKAYARLAAARSVTTTGPPTPTIPTVSTHLPEPTKHSLDITPVPHFTNLIKDVIRTAMLRPLLFIVGFFMFANMTGTMATRPYMIPLFTELGYPAETYRTLMVGGVGFLGSLCLLLTVARVGKRPIAIGSMALCSISALVLALVRHPWISFIAYLTNVFATLYGANGLVWTLISEVFPFRGRGLASGIAAASSYILSFAATKTFLNLRDLLGLPQVFFLYAGFSAGGILFLYYCLPETEGKSLQDIEEHYSSKVSSVPFYPTKVTSMPLPRLD